MDKETKILGFLPEDPAVHKAVLAQEPFLLLFPKAPISKRMMAIAETLSVQVLNEEFKQGEGFLGKMRSIFAKGRG